MIIYTLSLISSYNVRLFNYSQAVAILMGRLMCRVMYEFSTSLYKILDMRVRKIAWSSHSCRLVYRPKPSHLLLLIWCMAITGYYTSRNTYQLQPMAGYSQTRNLLSGASQSRKEKTTPNGRYSWQFKYVNDILIVLCMSSGLLCSYITGIHDKRIVTSCTMWHLSQTIGVCNTYCSGCNL